MEQLFPAGMQHYLVGGVLLGVAVGIAFVASGLITGMSTVFSSTWSYVSRLSYFQQERFVASRQWRLVMVLGLIIGAALYAFSRGAWQGPLFQTAVPWWQLGLGGFIAGYGARMSNGCTSGHGICGMASFQMPSILAVVIFLTTAIVTANLVSTLGGA